MRTQLVTTASTCFVASVAVLTWPLPMEQPAPSPAVMGQAASGQEPDEGLPSAEDVIAAYVAAIGGRDAVVAHTSRVVRYTFEGPYLTTWRTVWAQAPNRSRVRTERENGVLRHDATFDGKRGWVSFETDLGPHVMRASELDPARAEAEFYAELHESPAIESIHNLGVVEFDGRRCYKVRIVANAEMTTGTALPIRASVNNELIEFFDIDTGLMTGWEIPLASGEAGFFMREIQREYREFGGVLRPTELRRTYVWWADSGLEQVLTIDSIEDGVELGEGFVMPAELEADSWPWMTRLTEGLRLELGMVVADVGAGNGAWAAGMAREVGPEGYVFGNEITAELVASIRDTATEYDVDNVVPVLGSVTSSALPPVCCDRMLLRYVYHEIEHKESMYESMFQAVKPGGLLAIIDDSAEENHNIDSDVVIAQLRTAGFELVERAEQWNERPSRYFLLFRKPASER